MFKTKKVYAIRDTKTGLYSSGGMNPTFKRNGKIWNSIGALKCHLNLIVKMSARKALVWIDVPTKELDSSLTKNKKPCYNLRLFNETLKPYLDGTFEIVEAEMQPIIKGQLITSKIVSDLKNKEIKKAESQ